MDELSRAALALIRGERQESTRRRSSRFIPSHSGGCALAGGVRTPALRHRLAQPSQSRQGGCADHLVRAYLPLALRENEPIARNNEFADCWVGETLFEDVANDRHHLPGHGGESSGPQLVDENFGRPSRATPAGIQDLCTVGESVGSKLRAAVGESRATPVLPRISSRLQRGCVWSAGWDVTR